MDYSSPKSVGGTTTVTIQKHKSTERRLILIFGFEILLIILSLVESYHQNDIMHVYKPGLFNNGPKDLLLDIASGSFFSDQEKVEILYSSLINAILSFSLIITAIYQRESNQIQKFGLLLALIFGLAVFQLIKLATHNLIFMFVALTFIPAIYWYYIKYGEVHSFFDNRVVIFSIRRSIAIVPMFLAISLFTFFAMNFVGDPVGIATARIRWGKPEIQKTLLFRFGLQDENGDPIPAWKRYLYWIYEFLHGDLGESYEQYPLPVTDGIGFKLYLTLKLQIIALVIALFLSILIGIAAAYYHKTPADAGISAIALLGLSMPIFVSGILAILIFGGTGLDWFPTFGANHPPEILSNGPCGNECNRTPEDIWNEDFTSKSFINKPWLDFGWWGTLLKINWYYFLDGLNHLILPAFTIVFATMATFARLTRGTMLDVMRQDYILAARANGLTEYQIVRRHALKNVLLPLVTFLGISIGTLLVGAPITETIFTYPGLGAFFINALNTNDVPIIMALTMIITLMILFANLVADIAYTRLDPRISL